MAGVEVKTSFLKSEEVKTEIGEKVQAALGKIGADDYEVVTVYGHQAGPANVDHGKFLATVAGVVNSLGGLEPPRELNGSVSFLTTGPDASNLTAFIPTRVVPSPVGQPGM